MKILITGNKGFVGTATQKILEENNHQVIGYDLMDNLDIRDTAQLEKCVQENQPDRILHLAAIARFAEADNDQLLCDSTNVQGTKNVAAIAGKYHIPVIYSSTGSVYMPITETPPITESFKAVGNSEYATSKRKGELFIQRYAHPWIILRYSHLYGAEKRYHGLVGGFLARIQKGAMPTLYGGKQSNDFMYVKDVARANMIALNASWDKWNQIYNVGTGEETTAEVAGKLVCKLTGYKGKIETKQGRTVDPERFVFDVSKAERMLGFRTQYDFKTGLQEMLTDMELLK